MVNCAICQYYDSTNNICNLFRMHLQQLAKVDECDMDPNKQVIEGE